MRRAGLVGVLASLCLLSTTSVWAQPTFQVSTKAIWSWTQGGIQTIDRTEGNNSGSHIPLFVETTGHPPGINIFARADAGPKPGAVDAAVYVSAQAISDVGPQQAGVEAWATATGQWDDLIFSPRGGPQETQTIAVVAHYLLSGKLTYGLTGDVGTVNTSGAVWSTAEWDLSLGAWRTQGRHHCERSVSNTQVLADFCVLQVAYDPINEVYVIDLRATVPVNQPVTSRLSLTTYGLASAGTMVSCGPFACVPPHLDVHALSAAEFLHTLNFAPVAFTLPDGYTVNSPSMGIVDNVWTPAFGGGPTPMAIAIRPEDDPNERNVVNLKASGLLPVAILSTGTASIPSTLDVQTIRMGDPALTARVTPTSSHVEDVNGDGHLDLLLLFKIPDLSKSGAVKSDRYSD